MLEKSKMYPIPAYDWDVYDIGRPLPQKAQGASQMNGTIARLVVDKGFGFVKGEDGTEYFFHHSELNRPIKEVSEGDEVTFEVGESPKGPRANKVRLV